MFVIWDGSYVVARAQARFSSFTNSSGFPTGGIFGSLNMVGSDLSKVQPEYACVVFDRPSDGTPPARVKIYDQYKANRAAETAEERAAAVIKHKQRRIVREVLNLCGIKSVYAHKGWEADDTIAALTVRAVEAGQRVLVLTGDKDLCALAGPSVKLLDTKTTDGAKVSDYWREALGPRGVEDKYGVPPKRIPDLLALSGDGVDGVPKVPDVTRETAAQLISKFGSLRDVHTAFVSGKIPELNAKKSALLGDVAFLKRNLKLVRLNTDLITELDLGDYALKSDPVKVEEAAALLREQHQFKDLPKALRSFLSHDGKMSALKRRASLFD